MNESPKNIIYCRPWKQKHIIGGAEFASNGIWQERLQGLEFAMEYDCNRFHAILFSSSPPTTVSHTAEQSAIRKARLSR